MRSYIDTDPGLDDALAILAAFGAAFGAATGAPALDLRGITTVAGNIGLGLTTRNALRLATLAGRPDVPVVPGAAHPLVRAALDGAWLHGADGIGGVGLPEPARPAMDAFAPDWLARELARSDEPAQILALGPLTNVALLLRDHPAAARRLTRIVAMGGAIAGKGNTGPRSEFNIAADPEAAALVLGSGVPLVLIPLDVTRKVRAGPGWAAALLTGGPAARAAAAILGTYFDGAGTHSRPLHDPCVTLFALAPELFGTERMRLAVTLSDGDDPGALAARADPASPVEVALRVDAEAALAALALLLR